MNRKGFSGRTSHAGAMENFDFRELHPLVSMGTASDRYAGWIGQVYSARRYAGRITSRNHTVGGKSFTEKVLPVESVSEYFHHFSVLELDFTFYDTLLDANGTPTPTHRTLSAYARHLPHGSRVILKAPRMVFARKLKRKGAYTENAGYLDPALFKERFYEPALELLSPRLFGMVFEQEYQRAAERASPHDFARELDSFFSSIPRDHRYHVEIRTWPLATGPVQDVMKTHTYVIVNNHSGGNAPMTAREIARCFMDGPC